MIDMIKSEPEEKEPTGIIDGPHHFLRCSNCYKELMEIWVTRDLDFTAKYRAKCPWCSDYSFIKEIKGSIHIAGIFIPNPNDIEDDIKQVTTVENHDESGDIITFNVKRV